MSDKSGLKIRFLVRHNTDSSLVTVRPYKQFVPEKYHGTSV